VTPGVEFVVVMLVFLGLLTVGMTIPFAILVPSVLYCSCMRVWPA